MKQLVYSESEIMSHHDYAREHVVGGERVHGGFDAQGNYLSPRTRVRLGAVDAWTAALRERGNEIIPVDPAIVERERYPSEEQMKLLLREGVERVFWDSLTITGLLEARGRVLAEMSFPDLQEIIVEDISEMGIGHLNKGMLKSHGVDEGGEPGNSIGAHDVMWFVVRDLAFGPKDFPMATAPEFLGRPDAEKRLAPEIPEECERLILFMMNLLMIEYGAESLFSFNQRILRTTELFSDRRAQAEEAAQIIERIRQDEVIHVTSLRANLGELRSITFKSVGGGTVKGAEIIDRLFRTITHFVLVEAPKLQIDDQRKAIHGRILEHPNGVRILERFKTLEA
ncbi:MAG: hypothetical protein GY725_20570 [bacterium]|nr:hypothetical protein [bacterium]